MIKALYKGKKNLFVVLKDNENKSLYDVTEFCFKTEEAALKTIPKVAFDDYKKEFGLKPITFKELEDFYLDVKTKKDAKIRKVAKKIEDYTDEKKFPELRHFSYELSSGLTPLLTEGLLKLVAYVRVYECLSYWHDFEDVLHETLEDNLIKTESTDGYDVNDDILHVIDSIISRNYCDCVVKSNKYVFEAELELDDDETLDDESKTESDKTVKTDK